MGTVAKYQVSERQNFFDLALQHCGDVSAVFAMAWQNGLSVTDALEPAQPVLLTDHVNEDVVRYYTVKGIKPATDPEFDEDGNYVGGGDDWDDEGRIFALEFPYEFE